MRRLLMPLLFASLAGAPVYAQCTASLAAGPVKVRPYAAPPPPLTAALICARNEYCSFQVVVTATGEGCRLDDVAVSDFARGEQRLPDSGVTLYRQDFLPVFYRSSSQGDLGEWPDPLIPKTDPEYGEPRNAFPAEVRLVSRAYRKHSARNGRAITTARGTGALISGGRYASRVAQRFEIQIVRGGAVGHATFRWRAQPGPAAFSAEQVTQSQPLPLAYGVTVAFSSRGEARPDFEPGEEFWIFAGPARHQPIWVDVLIPADAPAGLYPGSVRVVTGGGDTALPVEIDVLPWTLPSTSSLPNFFKMSWTGNYAGHFSSPVDERALLELNHAYARAALRNGVTVALSGAFEPSYEFSADGRLVRADYTQYDAAVAPMMDGTGTPRGARWTALWLPRFDGLQAEQLTLAARDFVRHARERGWRQRLFDYLFDEPSTPEDFAALRERARAIMAAAPELPRLSSTDFRRDLEGVVTRWCPVVNHVAPKFTSLRQWKRNRDIPSREAYDARLRAGDALWWYQSCLSHGCRSAGISPEHDNWPSYMVDVSAVANRVFGLLTLRYNISGIFYWGVAYAHHHDEGANPQRLDAWESLYYFGGNGDGSLFYPGRPEQIGGTRHIPIESLRLKMIRDSQVDADYALMLRQLGEEQFLQRELHRLVSGAYRWNANPQAWLEFRARAGRRIAERPAQK